MLRPGQAVLYDADQPFMRGFSYGLRELALKIPRPLLEESADAAVCADRSFDFRSSEAAGQHANALAGLMRNALADPEPDAVRLEAAALDLFRILVNGDDSGGAGHFEAAKSFILQRLRDPQLSAPLVALRNRHQRSAAIPGFSRRRASAWRGSSAKNDCNWPAMP